MKGGLVPLVAVAERLVEFDWATERHDETSKVSKGAESKQASVSAEVATHYPFGSSSNRCKRSPSRGGKRAGQVASTRPTPIMSRR